jgi:hypothetical protein
VAISSQTFDRLTTHLANHDVGGLLFGFSAETGFGAARISGTRWIAGARCVGVHGEREHK